MADEIEGRLQKWLTLLANLGVIIGLIVLVVEVRQNAALTRLSVETGKNELAANIEFNLSGPVQTQAWIKSYRAPETLTEIELRMVESHLVAMMLQWDYMFQMEARGLVSEEQVRNHISNIAPPYFGSAFAKIWFEREMENWQGTRMLEVAGPIVADVDPQYMEKTYTELLDIAANLGRPSESD